MELSVGREVSLIPPDSASEGILDYEKSGFLKLSGKLVTCQAIATRLVPPLAFGASVCFTGSPTYLPDTASQLTEASHRTACDLPLKP